MRNNIGLLYRMLAAALLAVTPVAQAQVQTTGTPGSPDATTTIDGKQLPAQPGKFGGVIKESATDSKPYWPPRVVPPKGAPNILLIMTDDQGYGVSGTFGGLIPTQTMGPPSFSGIIPRSSLGAARRITTSPPTWRTTPSGTCGI